MKMILSLILIVAVLIGGWVFFADASDREESDPIERAVYDGMVNRWEKHDYKAAFECFSIGARANHPVALGELGRMLIDGFGPAGYDRVKGFEYVKRSAALGYVEAEYSLGYYYINGGLGSFVSSERSDGVEPISPIIQVDVKEGLRLYNVAAKKEHPMAIYRLGEYYLYECLYGKTTEAQKAADLAQALHWLKTGAAAEDAGCASMLGDMYLLGLGVQVDLREARKYFDQADAALASRSFSQLEEFIKERRSYY